METIIIQTEGSKLKLIKQLLKELGIAFETGKADVSPYDPEFVAKIKKAKFEDSIPVIAETLWKDIKSK
jgi:hypothetical protein